MRNQVAWSYEHEDAYQQRGNVQGYDSKPVEFYRNGTYIIGLRIEFDAAALAAGRKPCAQAAEHVAQVHTARGRRGEAPHDGRGSGRRRWRVGGGCCYVACVDVHADEYSAGRGGGDAAVACKLLRPRVARAGPPARHLNRRQSI